MNEKKESPSLLVFAPHLIYPTRNGADILIDRRWQDFSRFAFEVVILGMDTITTYSEGDLVNRESYQNTSRPKNIAALRALILQTHYNFEKFITNEFKLKAREILDGKEYHYLVFSFIWSTGILDEYSGLCNRKILIETHNDEILWYQNLRQASVNPLSILISRTSERWVRRFFDRASPNWIFLHLTEKDRQGYNNLAPGHQSLLAPVGIDIKGKITHPRKKNDPVHLLFVGALGVKMNLDALVFFAENYLDILVQRSLSEIKIHIVGSSPSSKVIQLCSKKGWTLHPDVTDDQLAGLYQIADFSILPFPYTTGSKIKLLHSIAHNLPFIATKNLFHQFATEPPLCLFSDDPLEWVEHINQFIEYKDLETEYRQLKTVAEDYSWEKTTGSLYADLVDLGDDR